MTTTQLVGFVKNRIGEDSDTNPSVSRAFIVQSLSEAQRMLAAAGPILRTIFKGNSIGGAEATSLPTPDFYAIIRVEVRRTDVKKELEPMLAMERPVDRTTVAADVPSRYLIWGGNDAAGNNVQAILFDKNFGTSGVEDLWIWIRQRPKTLVEGVQDPEVSEDWQDGMMDYAEYRARARMASVDPNQVPLARLADQAWKECLMRAKAYKFQMDRTPRPIDRMGYTEDEY